jgi:hypothetical protein
MVMVTTRGAVEPFCCWLRPSPPDLDINLHCTYNRILEAVRIQQWFPPNCHYCKYRPKHVDDYERHIVIEHPGKMAYPGPPPENVTRALCRIEELKLVNGGYITNYRKKPNYRKRLMFIDRSRLGDEN